ncbi:unnamed protein product [Bursaphelenchus okinawaensis]|uniref:Uncharacterized protein n=1 Tax=Bursaphelenchus okinawaensis TaxID=465554 RepID=A0A811L0M4_9BILA|nr:unnamed protein product [Bursaphelenchus okinawaensis]CAG9114031.1 unnamed protein product [Bursaphelenchus okinawaensis]
MVLIVKYALLAIVLVSTTHGILYNRYVPDATGDAIHYVRGGTQKISIEVLSRFHMAPQMVTTATQLIKDNFSDHSWMDAGDESNVIGDAMEKSYGGHWMVGQFSAAFDVAYSIVRRSPAYILFLVNERHVLIAQESPNPKFSNYHTILRK